VIQLAISASRAGSSAWSGSRSWTWPNESPSQRAGRRGRRGPRSRGGPRGLGVEAHEGRPTGGARATTRAARGQRDVEGRTTRRTRAVPWSTTSAPSARASRRRGRAPATRERARAGSGSGRRAPPARSIVAPGSPAGAPGDRRQARRSCDGRAVGGGPAGDVAGAAPPASRAARRPAQPCRPHQAQRGPVQAGQPIAGARRSSSVAPDSSSWRANSRSERPTRRASPRTGRSSAPRGGATGLGHEPRSGVHQQHRGHGLDRPPAPISATSSSSRRQPTAAVSAVSQ
jgi:hypothetical protein